MMKNPIVVNLSLILIAVIWGFGFVPQRLGMEHMGAAAFNAIRFGLGAMTLIPLLVIFKSVNRTTLFNPSTLALGAVLGFILYGGATFQQIAIQYTALANVAFITGLYVHRTQN